MNLDIISNISKIGSGAWNNLNINDHPFTNYDFLYALEVSKSVCAETGWLPQHIIVKDIDNKIIGILPNTLRAILMENMYLITAGQTLIKKQEVHTTLN